MTKFGVIKEMCVEVRRKIGRGNRNNNNRNKINNKDKYYSTNYNRDNTFSYNNRF